jgi:hypothetical protein
MLSTPSDSDGQRSAVAINKTQAFGESMGELIVLGLLISVGTWLYKVGKSIGSRKGFHVGRSRGRR